MHACLEHQEIKNSSSQSPGGGQRSSPLCSLLPKTSPQFCMLFFTQQTEGIIFSRVTTDVHHHTKALHAPEIAELHKSTRRSGKTQSAQHPHEAPASHMQGALTESWKWSVCWQLFAETGGIDYLLGVVWGCLGTLSGLSNSIPSLSLCLTGQSERLWGGCLPMSRQVLNIWCVPSVIGSLLMAIFNIRPPRSKAWHSLWAYPINNVPP